MTLLHLYILAAATGAGATLAIALIQYWGEVRLLLSRWADMRRARRRLARARRRLGR
jgi:hypothetical protein